MNYSCNFKKLLAISLSTSLLFASFGFAGDKVLDNKVSNGISISIENSDGVSRAVDDLNKSIKSIESKIDKHSVDKNDLIKLTENINNLEKATRNSNRKATRHTITAILNAEILLLYLPDNDISSASAAIDNARKSLNIGGYKASIPTEDNMSTIGEELVSSINILLKDINERADFAIELINDNPNILSTPLDRVAVKLSSLSKVVSSNQLYYEIAINDENMRNDIVSAFVKAENLLDLAKNNSPKKNYSKSITEYLESQVKTAKKELKIESKNNKKDYYIPLEQGGGSPIIVFKSSNGFPIKIVDQEITLPTKENLKTYGENRMYEDHERAFLQKAFETIKIVNRNDEYYLRIELPELPEGFIWEPSFFAINEKAEYLCYGIPKELDNSPGLREWKLEKVTKEEISNDAFLSFYLLIKSTKNGSEGSLAWKLTTDHHPGYLIERTECYTQYTTDAWVLFNHGDFLEGWK